MTESFPLDAWKGSMVQVLGRLSDPVDVQLAYLSRLGVEGSIDELALEFDDVFKPLLPALAEQGKQEVVGALRAVDAALSSETLEWSSFALRSSSDWERIRVLAREALGFLGDIPT